MIEKNKFRKKRSRPSSKRPSAFKHLNGSNSPKTRVSITRALEKYISMAQDAHSNGDRIVAENFYQYAEHYQRLLNEDKSHGNLSVDDKLKNKNSSDSEMTDIKLSRTQRAINAKDERYKKIELRMVQKNKKVLPEMVLKLLNLFSQILAKKKATRLKNSQLPLIP